MKYYFRLQFLVFKRQVEDTGLHFIAGLSILLLIYVFLFLLTRAYPDYTGVLVVYLALYMLHRQIVPNRLDFLKSIFLQKQFAKIRLIESSLCIVPFIPLLVYSQQWWLLLVVLFLPLVFMFDVVRSKSNLIVYAPFKSTAFEFIILFRKFWLYVLLTYVVCVIGLYYENTMLCIVLTVGMVFFTVSAYDFIEEEYVLWNYTLYPQAFIKHKVKEGILQFSILLSPMLFLFLLFDRGALLWATVVWGVGVLLIMLAIFMKYSVYPRRLSIIEGVKFIPVAFVPVLVIVFFPFYYRKAIKNLKNFL